MAWITDKILIKIMHVYFLAVAINTTEHDFFCQRLVNKQKAEKN